MNSMTNVIRGSKPIHRPPPPETGSKVMRYVILGLVTATIVGAWPLMRWYQVWNLQDRWQAEDEERERSRGQMNVRINQFLQGEATRRWSLAESRRDQRMKAYEQSHRDIKPGTRPPDDCTACEGLGLIKAPPAKEGKAALGIADCTACQGTGVATRK